MPELPLVPEFVDVELPEVEPPGVVALPWLLELLKLLLVLELPELVPV